MAGTENSTEGQRRRGRKPEDAGERRARVEEALRQLESARVPFTMADVAERAGISRATLYRDAGLRDLIGSRGDGPPQRPVDRRVLDDLRRKAESLAQERRALRRALREAEKRLKETEARADRMEAEAAEAGRTARAHRKLGPEAAEKVRTDAYAEGFAAGARAAGRGHRGGAAIGSADLVSVAGRLPRPALLAARRSLARALHPDLFARDPAASLLATELLKQINALIGPHER